jgi:TetR/AcrR family transcriptional regulator, mexJK operon transcriptional repressor
MTVVELKPVRGRPRDPVKRIALLDTARALFLEFGADAVTIDQVVAGAKVSRATFYSNFADRHQLLAAVIGRESERIVTDEAVDGYEAATLREALTTYGDSVMRFLADPDVLRFEPLIMHVRQAQPALAASFFAAGPQRVWDILGRIVRAELSDVDPAQAVNDLIGLWQGSWRTEIAYGQREAPDEQEIRLRSWHAVDVFMRAYERRN